MRSLRIGQRAARADVTTQREGTTAERSHRQALAFGAEGQRRLASLQVGIVGLGGAGSLFVESLAHLGVGALMLVDPDSVEQTNLNRLVGASPADATGRLPKVDVAARLAHHIDPSISVAARRASLLETETWQWLRAADVLVGAVDSAAARWALNRLAVQYAKPYVDVGVEVTPGGVSVEAAGHVAVVRPGGPCLRCLQGYDARDAARELQPHIAELKQAAGYLSDLPEVQAPSVIFLNQAVVAYAVAELLNLLVPWKPAWRYLLVDLSAGTTTRLDADPDPACPVCGPEGVRGLADAEGPPSFRTELRLPPPPIQTPPVAPPTRRIRFASSFTLPPG